MSARGPAAAMAPPQAPSDFRGTLRRITHRLLRDRVAVWTILVLGIVGTALSVAGPRILGVATDIVFRGYLSSRLPEGASQEEVVAGLRADGQDRMADVVAGADVTPGAGMDYSALVLVLLGAVALYVVGSAFMLWQGRLTTFVVQRMVGGLRTDVEATLHRLPLSFVDGEERGELMSRTTNDIDNIGQSMQQTISQLVTSLLMVLGTLAMMVWISPVLALVAVVTIPVAFVLTKAVMKRSQPQFMAQWGATGRLNGHVEEVFTGHEIVKVFGRQADVREEFERRNHALFTAAFKAQFISGIVQPLMMLVSNLNYVAVAVLGSVRVASGSLTIGEVQAFIQYSRQFTQPLTQIASMVTLLQSGLASAERVLALLDQPEQSPDPIDPPRPGDVRGRVAFESVSFSYTQAPLIEGLDLAAEPGSTVAIVGPTGAGKTTLVNLLLRFYELDGGRITLDGVDVATMSRADLRGCFGVVLQDAWLFKGTISENIAYGSDHELTTTGSGDDADGPPASVVRAAEAALVDHLVRTLPDGYDTLVEEGGSGVSAGQRQLLTIARAFHADPPILVLDEATSSVDTRTEALVQEAMAGLRRGRTSFVIAHRLSTIREADLIVVMDAGRIVEQGTHESLLAAGGTYARLYAAQFAGATT
ncbi:ABC transporter ATP-binding protein [Aeromicrobium sp. CF4.19]|uniref:ABC transporter ATP-binding protein n=1 Tax=Aeromicrobium sp. CF4.19 TaxID=3373082 RepID=UPI003EE56C50